MKGRHVTSCALMIQLLCASLLIHNLVGAAPPRPQGLISGASFVPDIQRNFNNLPQNSDIVQPGIQLNGPNFISALHSGDQSAISNSRPQEPIFTISRPQETTINRSQPPQPTISISQPQESTISNSQPLETINTIQPPESSKSISQPQFANQNVLPANSQVPQQSVFIKQPPVTDFINIQPIAQEQPDFTLRSQSENILPQQQNVVNDQSTIHQGVQQSFTVIRDDENPLQPQQNTLVGNTVNQVGSVNRINSNGEQLISTSGASSIVNFLPEDQIVELQIPFFTNPKNIPPQPVNSNTFNQNQLQQDNNAIQPQLTFVDSLAKNLDSTNSVDTQVDNFVKRGPSIVKPVGSTFDSNTQTGVPLTAVVSTVNENNNVGVPISLTTSLDNVNKNPNAQQASVPNTVSGDNNVDTPLSSTVHVATEDNTLRSSQTPTSDADINLIASISSAINNDASLRSALEPASGTTTSGDFGSQTLGEVLLSMNGQDGIIVLPMDALGLGGSLTPELAGSINNNDITFRADEGISAAGATDTGATDYGATDAGTGDADLGSALDTFIEDYGGFDDYYEELPPAPPSPPNIFRSTLADTLFVKGQFLGTILGGLLDLGGAITGQLKPLISQS